MCVVKIWLFLGRVGHLMFPIRQTLKRDFPTYNQL